MKNRRMWTPIEVGLMQEHYPHVGPDGMIPILHNMRSRWSIIEKAHIMGIKCSDALLKAHRAARQEEERARREEQRKESERLAAIHCNVPPEYIQAQSIWQVGYRVAAEMGQVGAFA